MSIAALIEAVEAGTPSMRNFIDAFGGIPMGNDIEAYNAYHGSLNAARALHDALLPGWFPGMSQNIHHGHWYAWVQDKATAHFSAEDNDPARAWLMAILRAKEAGQ